MKKFILLTLTLIALAFNAQAGTGGGNTPTTYWFQFKATMTTSPTGAGKVYGSFTSAAEAASSTTQGVASRHRQGSTSSTEYTSNDINLYLKAYTEPGYEFVEWQNSKGERVANLNKEEGTAIVKAFHTHNMCGINNSSGKCDNSNSSAAANFVDSTYVAIFRKIESTAVTVSAVGDYCKAEVLPVENHNGDEVTLWAYNGNAKPDQMGYRKKFLGWKHNGEIVSRESSITFTVDDSNKGEYTAVFEDGYKFGRFKNVKTGKYLTITYEPQGTPSITQLPNTITLKENDYADPGSIVRINSYKNTDQSGRYVYEFLTQNTTTNQYYQLPSVYIRMNLDNKRNAWMFSTQQDEGGTMLGVNDSGAAYFTAISDDGRCSWKFEPLDKDLTEEPECWFTVDPANCVEASDGSFYTTMRTEFNYKYDRDKVTAYVVSGRNDEDGTLQLTEINSNIIPGKTCVLLKLTSTEAADNVFIPTESGSSFDPSSVTNLLVSTPTDGSYFANQSTSEENMKALTTLANGEIGFGGNALTSIDGNRCYLQIPKDYIIIPEVKLTTVIKDNYTNKKYDVHDLICVMAVPDEDGNAVLYCKDDNKYANPDIKGDNEKDYILNTFGGVGYRNDHDQSNWIALYAPASLFAASQQAPGLMAEPMSSSRISELAQQKINNVVGTVTDVKNPSLTLKTIPVSKEANEYTFNTYVPANFHGSQYGYFFVSPKPMEVAQIRWAMWTGDHFESVTSTATTNTAGLVGAFDVNWSLMNTPVTPVANHVYDFLGLVKIESAANNSAYAAMGTLDRYVVYPFNLEEIGSVVDGIVTGIDTIDSAMVKSVKYYNMLGVESDTPHEGVNIIVTTMDNGTKKTSKRIF